MGKLRSEEEVEQEEREEGQALFRKVSDREPKEWGLTLGQMSQDLRDALGIMNGCHGAYEQATVYALVSIARSLESIAMDLSNATPK